MRGGPARSFWQVEPDTAFDICVNYLKFRKPLLKRVAKTCSIPESELFEPNRSHLAWLLEINIAFGISMCRLKYRRDKDPLPDKDDIDQQAAYWLRVYNAGGKGTIKHYKESQKILK